MKSWIVWCASLAVLAGCTSNAKQPGQGSAGLQLWNLPVVIGNPFPALNITTSETVGLAPLPGQGPETQCFYCQFTNGLDADNSLDNTTPHIVPASANLSAVFPKSMEGVGKGIEASLSKLLPKATEKLDDTATADNIDSTLDD